MYDSIHDALCELIDAAQWQNKPDLLRRILPILLEDQLAQEDGKGAALGKARPTPHELAIQTVSTLNEFLRHGDMSDRTKLAVHSAREAVARESFDAARRELAKTADS
jgi:hypothetical protein